ncbi:titin homolog isoform X2 [Cardiocondyla obscurior]|uniref:titin homolog isoform X2 n=1 Tax=Cardiocondyla obscurior TaxID=286306 RepID=UPI0039657525
MISLRLSDLLLFILVFFPFTLTDVNYVRTNLCLIIKFLSCRSRGSFLKFARRQLRRKFGMTGSETTERVTFRERCLAICPFLNKLFPRKQNVCLLCGAVERYDQEPHIKCATPDCVGLFCIQCFADLQNLCTICRSPVEYGDLSDISEEKDSSDDQLIVKKGPVPITTNIDKKEEPIVEEKRKGEIVATEKVEVPSEERISKKIVAKKLAVEEEISKKISEKQQGKIERVLVEKKDEAVQTDVDIDESSSDSVYSYTYQKGSRETEIKRRRVPFRDIEAQKIREDVTIQIFNEPLAKDITSSSEDPTSCFVVRARRRLRARLKRKSRSSPRKDDSGSSTSIADTESCSTEELDEEEVIHIEMDDGSKELLLKNGTGKAGERSTRVGRILAALTKISWLGKRTTTDSDGEWRMRKPSLLDRIARMLPRNQSTSPVRMYRRIRTTKKDVRRKDFSSVSSSASDEESERDVLLKPRDRQVDCLQIISDHDDSGGNIYSRNYDSHRARRGTVCRRPDSHARADDTTVKYPHEKKFAAKELPRRLQPISRDTAYFEVDEIKDSQLERKCVRSTDRVNVLSDTRIFDIDNKRRDKWNITKRDNYAQIPCACTPQISSRVRDNGSESDSSAITEQSNEISTTNGVPETKTEKIVSTGETMADGETDRQRGRKKSFFENGQRKLLAKNNRASVRSNNTVEENGVRKCDAKNEQAEELAGAEKSKEKVIASTSVANDKARLYDPLASLKLYGVTCQVKGREKLAVEKLTKQSGAPEIRIDRTTAKFVEDIEMVQKSVQVSEHEVRKSAAVSAKSIQANLRKLEKCKRYDKISHIGAKICRATGLGKKDKKREEEQEKGIDKCKKHRKPRSSEKKKQLIKRKYDVDVTETRLEIPMLKKYLPPYQAPGLIEELKEHDRMRLIQEREARRWTALSALRSTRDSPSSAKSRDQACGTSVICNVRETVSGLTSVSTRLTEANTLPYQETQTFKDVVREFRKKMIAASERPPISLSQGADKCKDLKQLFPPKNEDHEGFTAAPKFEKVVNRFKPTCDKQKTEEECTTIYRAVRRFESESFSEMSSICSYPRDRRFDDSTSADEITDNNVDIP